MHRRVFLATAIAALPGLAMAQAPPPPLISPQNELERVFLSALTDEAMRPVFRRALMASEVAMAMASFAPGAAPRIVDVRPELSAAAVFTSAGRLDSVLGAVAARRIMTGRQAFEMLGERHVVLNFRLAPMLTLEPEDVAAYLSQA